MGRRFTIFALFYFVFEGKFQVHAHRGGGGRVLGGLVFGGGYTWRGIFSEFYGNRKKKNFVSTHPLSGSKAISLGSSSPKDSTVCWLLPDRSDLDIVSCVVSVQYNSDVVH